MLGVADESKDWVAAEIVDHTVDEPVTSEYGGGDAAQPFLVMQIFLLLLGVQYLMWAMRLYCLDGGGDSAPVAALKAEIAALRRNAQAYKSPATFVQLSKVQRAILKKEKTLEDLASATAQVPARTLAQVLAAKASGTAGEMTFSALLIFWHWSTPVVVLPSNWVLPLGVWGRLMRREQATSVGVVLWVGVCSRVAGRVFNSLHPDAKPGFDFAKLRKSMIGF